ncbi:MAG: hypothetical protein RBS07_09780 [Lentimicrobium sp.]|jgi:hypothetical protein|nr:hypothetical protein [Lentimicrobium sp.]
MKTKKPPNNDSLYWQILCRLTIRQLSIAISNEVEHTQKKLEAQTHYHRIKNLWYKIRASTFVDESDQVIILEAFNFINKHPRNNAQLSRLLFRTSPGSAFSINFIF